MSGIRTCDCQLECRAYSALGHLVTLAEQAYFIITDMLIYR